MWDAIWVQLVTAQADVTAPKGILDILMDTNSYVVIAVLVLLALLSLMSWYIIGYKWFYLRRVHKESLKFLEVFWESKRLDNIFQSAEQFPKAPVSQVFKAGYIELSKLKKRDQSDGSANPNDSMRVQLSGIENVDRSLRRATSTEMTQLEAMVPFLATVGSTAPFIGLFGTVWGIMAAFVNIDSAGAAGLDVVAGPIAEALIVTAAGLFAAIPSVVFYNIFVNRIRVLGAEMENFSSDFLNIVKRHFFD